MRYVTLIIALSGTMAAQTPNWQNPKWQQDIPGFLRSLKSAATESAEAPRKCAIPLTNVLKKDNTNDRIAVPVPKSHGKWTMPVLAPPAPACEEPKPSN